MIYPIAVLVIAGLVVAVILWKVIPTFAELFQGLGATLPLPTRAVIWMSQSFIKFFPFMAAAAVIFAILVQRYYSTDGGRHRIDAALLKLPVLGGILRKIAVAPVCRTLATLVSFGLPILY